MRRACGAFAVAILALLSSGCSVGPKYKTPSAPAPVAYKEAPPDGWKEAHPSDGELKGKWWELFGDSTLNALEEQVSISNQNVIAAEAQYRQARAAVRVARSGLFPTLGGRISNSESRAGGTNVNSTSNNATSGQSSSTANGTGSTATSSSNSNSSSAPLVRTTNNVSLDVSWEPDLWGGIRHGVTAGVDRAQASAAQLEAAKLLYQTELAEDYFQLRALDTEQDLLTRTVASYQDYVKLTRDRFNAGVASELDMRRAETQLYAVQTQLTDLGVQRAAFEHASAILTGKAPAEVTVAAALLNTAPPAVPVGAPSELLERRPDIAAAERNVAAANEEVGIAKAAYFPSLTLTGSIGFAATSFAKWFSAPSRFWSIGPAFAGTILDFGGRRGRLDEARAGYDTLVANYRQTVLTALGQVEDELAALRILERESAFEQDTITAATRSLDLATEQYRAGTISYLDVITAQAALLESERGAVQLLGRRLVSSVLLIQALGGGWKDTDLPGRKDVMSKPADNSHDF